MTNAERAAKLKQAADLLNLANCLQQEALGTWDNEECYGFHNELEDLIERFDELASEIKGA